jgi:hypothetical protein
MSADLADLKRLKVTPETRAWLTARARMTGKSQQELARDALHEMEVKEIHAAKVLTRLAPDSDLDGASGGRR